MEEKPINFSEKSIDRLIVSLRRQARQFGVKCQGRSMTQEGKTFSKENYPKPKAGKDVIDFGEGLLLDFADESNLIGKKSHDTMLNQRERTALTFSKYLFTSPSAPAENHNFLITTFRNILQNIFDVIMNSRDLLQDSFKKGGIENEATF